jgi:hypothetical protein
MYEKPVISAATRIRRVAAKESCLLRRFLAGMPLAAEIRLDGI